MPEGTKGSVSVSGEGQAPLVTAGSDVQPASSVSYASGGGDKASPAFEVKTLNLPKGGGTVQGMGETAQVNRLTGVCEVSLPIYTSDCRGFSPALSVSYSAGGGNSAFGFGMSLNIPSIVISTQQQLPLYEDNPSALAYHPDVYLLMGGDYLVPVPDSVTTASIGATDYNIVQYRVATESEFNLIERWSAEDDSEQVFWKVVTRNHIVQIYGYTSNARIVNPNNSAQIFEWLLQEVYDSTGQHQIYLYQQEDTDNVDMEASYESTRQQTANRYLDRIRYGNTTAIADSLFLSDPPNPLLTDNTAWHFEAVLDYGQYNFDPDNVTLDLYVAPGGTPPSTWACREDSFSTYGAGFEIRTHRLCQNIFMFHRFHDEFDTGDTPVLVHATVFTHYMSPSETSAFLNQLHRAQSIGYVYHATTESYTSTPLPPVILDYQAFTLPDLPISLSQLSVAIPEHDKLVGVNNGPYYTLVDLYNEGLPGILYTDGQTTAYRSAQLQDSDNIDSSIVYGEPDFIDFPNFRQLIPDTVSFMDVTLDNQKDLMLNTATQAGYFSMDPLSGQWQGYTTFSGAPTERLVSQHQWGDMSGNGLLDLVLLDTQLTGKNLRIYPALGGEEGWSHSYTVSLSVGPDGDTPLDFPSTLEGCPTVLRTFTDLAGAGVAQFVEVTNHQVRYWPNLGYGRFMPPVVMGNSPVFETEETLFDVRRLFLADINGSGVADLIYFKEAGFTVYFNQNGNTFSDGVFIELGEDYHYDLLDQVTFIDLYGQGTTGLLFSLLHATDGPKHYYYDFTGGQKPYLLTHMDNQRGSQTTIAYRSSVRDYLYDKANGVERVTVLPFPVQVVGNFTVQDQLIKTGSGSSIVYASLTQRYTYHHGYFDPIERDFRGFGCVESVTTSTCPAGESGWEVLGSDYVKPTLEKTWYHLGIAIPEVFAEEYYQGDSQAFESPEDHYSYLDPSPDLLTVDQGYRALKGSVIHQEIYDAQHVAAGPYSVSEGSFTVVQLQPITYPATTETPLYPPNPYAVFQTHGRESLAYDYQQDPEDPRISQNFVLAVDAYNSILHQVAINYPRRGDTTFASGNWYATWSRQEVVNGTASADTYQLGVPIQTRQYYLPIISGFPLPESGEAITWDALYDYFYDTVLPSVSTTPSSTSAQLYAWQRHYYGEIDSEGETISLGYGNIAIPLLPYQTATAAYIQSDIEDILTPISATIADYLTAGDYRSDEVTIFGDTWWWAYSSQPSYLDASDFYLPKSITDVADNITTYTYDTYNLLLQSVTDPLANEVQVETFNYQRLMPVKLNDINDNTSEVQLDGLGRVVYATFYGHEQAAPIGFAHLSNAPTTVPDSLEDVLTDPLTYLVNLESGIYYPMAHYFYYDDMAWARDGKPTAVAALTATVYDLTTDVNQIQMQVQYSDGLGRVLQTVQAVNIAEVGESAVYSPDEIEEVSCYWQNSGLVVAAGGAVVKSYEPFYTDSYAYLPYETIISLARHAIDQTPAPFTQSSIQYYDALGRIYQAQTTKGFITQTTWTPWERTSYDVGDTVENAPYYIANTTTPVPSGYEAFVDPSISENEADALAYAAEYYHDTPVMDAYNNRGQIISSTTNNQGDGVTTQTLVTHYVYDEINRLKQMYDPRLRSLATPVANITYHYGLLAGSGPLSVVSVDAGTNYSLSHSMGVPLYLSNSRTTTLTYVSADFATLYYDALWRVLQVHVSKTANPAGSNDPLTLTNRLVKYYIYGENVSVVDPQDYNLRGRLYTIYDEAGREIYGDGYTIGGSPISTERNLRIVYKEEANWSGTSTDDSLLQSTTYSQGFTYDALERVTEKTDARGNKHYPSYYLSGRLSGVGVKLAEASTVEVNYLSDLTYNGLGQTLTSTLNNGVTTHYTYEDTTHRIRILDHVKAGSPPVTLQSLDYDYDPVGNVVGRTESSLPTQYYNNQEVVPELQYEYDSLYRLIQASGPELLGLRQGASQAYSSQRVHAQDKTAVSTYTERYSYQYTNEEEDVVDSGNNLMSRSRAGSSTYITVSPTSNRGINALLTGAVEPGEDPDVEGYFDLCGNVQSITTATAPDADSMAPLYYDYRNQLQCVNAVIRTPGNDNDAEYYVYDRRGQRIRKVYEHYTGTVWNYTEVIYIDGVEIRQTLQGPSTGPYAGENVYDSIDPSSVIPDSQYISTRIEPGSSCAVTHTVWTINPPTGITGPFDIYHLRDILRSSVLEVDESAGILKQAEYYPFGGIAMEYEPDPTDPRLSAIHYRYSGQELDSVSGLYYYGARYYQSDIGRWLNPDPAGFIDGLNVYAFVGNNPITHFDVGGMTWTGTYLINRHPGHPLEGGIYQGYKSHTGAFFVPRPSARGRRPPISSKEDLKHIFYLREDVHQAIGSPGPEVDLGPRRIVEGDDWSFFVNPEQMERARKPSLHDEDGRRYFAYRSIGKNLEDCLESAANVIGLDLGQGFQAQESTGEVELTGNHKWDLKVASSVLENRAQLVKDRQPGLDSQAIDRGLRNINSAMTPPAGGMFFTKNMAQKPSAYNHHAAAVIGVDGKRGPNPDQMTMELFHQNEGEVRVGIPSLIAGYTSNSDQSFGRVWGSAGESGRIYQPHPDFPNAGAPVFSVRGPYSS